jgi:hypothetical protein
LCKDKSVKDSRPADLGARIAKDTWHNILGECVSRACTALGTRLLMQRSTRAPCLLANRRMRQLAAPLTIPNTASSGTNLQNTDAQTKAFPHCKRPYSRGLTHRGVGVRLQYAYSTRRRLVGAAANQLPAAARSQLARRPRLDPFEAWKDLRGVVRCSERAKTGGGFWSRRAGEPRSRHEHSQSTPRRAHQGARPQTPTAASRPATLRGRRPNSFGKAASDWARHPRAIAPATPRAP